MLLREELEIGGGGDRAGLFLQGDEALDLRFDGREDQARRILGVDKDFVGGRLDEPPLAVGVGISGRGRPVQLRHPFGQAGEDGAEELGRVVVLLSLHDPRRDTRREFALGKPLELAVVDGVHAFFDGLQDSEEIVEGLPADHHGAASLLDPGLLFFSRDGLQLSEASERVVEGSLVAVPDGRVFRCQIVELHGAMSSQTNVRMRLKVASCKPWIYKAMAE